MQGVSPEAASGQTNDVLLNQIYTIGNPGPALTTLSTRMRRLTIPTAATPADCTADYGVQEDSLGNVIGAACATNAVPNSANNPYDRSRRSSR